MNKNAHARAKNSIRATWALCFSLCAASLGCAHDTEHEGPEVTSLKIKGNDDLSSKAIKSKIVTEPTGWWPFAKRKDYDPVTWEKDQKRAERLYKSRGYFNAKVEGSRVPVDMARDKDAKVKLTMSVTEGPRATVERLHLEGLEALEEKPRLKLQRRLPLKEKDPFTESEWEETKDLIDSRLRATGHAEAKVQGRAVVDVETSKVDATIWVAPGPIYRFGSISVEQGREPFIPPLWIEEQVRLAAPLDEVYNPDSVTEAQRRVFAMNVFSRADVELGEPDAETKRVPLIVKTQTGPYHLLRLGGGAGFDQVRNELRVIGEWTDNNFMGGLRTLRLRSRAGWAFIPNAYSTVTGSTNNVTIRNGPVGLLRAEFEQPRMFGAPAWKFGYHVEGEKQLQEAFDSLSGRTGPELIWQLRADLRISAGYTFEASDIDLIRGASANLFQNEQLIGCPAEEMTNDQEPTQQKRNNCLVLISYLTQRVTFDRRDDPMAPRRGFYLDAQLQEAGGPLSGTYTYLRAMADARGYISFGKFTFAARAQAGGLFPTGGSSDTPIQHRFYAGGGMSMRGFGYRRLSPLLEIPRADEEPSATTQAVVIGGNGLFVSNLETRYQISPSVLLAAFYDTGSVTPDFNNVFAEKLFHAVGGGVRIVTPVGVLRLDIGRRFARSTGRQLTTPEPGSLMGVTRAGTENTSCFGFGGNGSQANPALADGLCQIHISVGEAF